MVFAVAGYSIAAYQDNNSYNNSVTESKSLAGKFNISYDTAMKTATSTDPNQLSDAKTLTRLKKELRDVKKLKKSPDTTPDSILLWETLSARNEQQNYVSRIKTEMPKLVTLQKAVIKSRDAKALEDAQAALKTSLATANALYTSSDGQVADNATRDSLKQTIDAATQLSGQKAAKNPENLTKQLTDMKAKLNAACKCVTDSQGQKQQADAQAAARAQAAAQAQTAAVNQRRKTQRSTTPGSTSRYSSGQRGPTGQSGQENANSGSVSTPEWNGELDLGDILGTGGPLGPDIDHDKSHWKWDGKTHWAPVYIPGTECSSPDHCDLSKITW